MRTLALVLLAMLGALDAGAAGLSVPAPTLPGSEPDAPVLLVSASDVPLLQARRTDPRHAAGYARVRAFVDGKLAALAADPGAIGDAKLGAIALGAALLGRVGETPPASFPTYRDAAVRALATVGSRSPGGPSAPADAIDLIRDPPGLQTIALAYDLLRGTGVQPGYVSILRAKVADWADALNEEPGLSARDLRDHRGVVVGAALVTTALTLPRHPRASAWLASGAALVNASLGEVASEAGWWREGAYFANLALEGLVPAAVAVERTGGVSWWNALSPLVRFALDFRQPDGTLAPFEDGIPVAFPFDLVAPRYPALAAQLSWAAENSPRDADAHRREGTGDVLRFLLATGPAPVAPAAPSTRFARGDTHGAALRSSWAPDARAIHVLTAPDHASTVADAGRHHTQNPLDLVVWGSGRLLLPTASGGPQLAQSARRGAYLRPDSKNVPLVAGTAPFVTDPSAITSEGALDSHDDGGRANNLLDALRTTVTAYANAPSVSRTVAMVGDAWFVVADELTGAGAQDFALPFRGRGARALLPAAGALARVRWSHEDAVLELAAIASPPIAIAPTAGHYAPALEVEEEIAGIELRARATSLRALTILVPRAASAAAPTITAITGSVPAVRVASGAYENELVFAGGASATVGDLTTDAVLALVRRSGGQVTGFAMIGGTRLTIGGATALFSSQRASVAVVPGRDGLIAEFVPSTPDPTRLDIGLVPSDANGFVAYASGNALQTDEFGSTTSTWTFTRLASAATLRVEPNRPLVLDAVPPLAVRERDPLRLELRASDPDGTPVTFALASEPALPADAVFDPVTGTLDWTPDFDLARRGAPATFALTLQASDSAATVRRTTTITVTNRNRPPAFDPLPPATVRREATVSLDLRATDADGDGTAYAIEGTNATIDASTGRFRWTPPRSTPLGRATFTILASDGEETTPAALAVEVVEENRAPVVVSVADVPVAGLARIYVPPGVAASIYVKIQDPDGDAFTCALEGAPPALTWDPVMKRIFWAQPDATVAFTFACTDTLGARSSLPFELVLPVKAPPPEPAESGCAATDAGALALLAVLLRRRARGPRRTRASPPA